MSDCMSNAHMDLPLPIGTNRCRCAECGEYFSGVWAFDRHRAGRGCKNPADIGLIMGKGHYWGRPPSERGAEMMTEKRK